MVNYTQIAGIQTNAGNLPSLKIEFVVSMKDTSHIPHGLIYIKVSIMITPVERAIPKQCVFAKTPAHVLLLGHATLPHCESQMYPMAMCIEQ